MRAAADALVQQLRAKDLGLRDKAATALQTMGKKAGKALAAHISNNLSSLSDKGVTKAVTILGKIGNDVVDDCNVRESLLSAACMPQSDWSGLELRVAAIDALGEINKYRGSILAVEEDDPLDTSDPAAGIAASKKLADTARRLFEKLSNDRSEPTPSATPTAEIKQNDADFYTSFHQLYDSQAKLVKLAAQVNAAASPSKKNTEPAFPKLADAKTFAAVLRKIDVGYFDATKINFAAKAADQADDKSHWQLKTEAAYDLLTETSQLSRDLDSLKETIPSFRNKQADLRDLLDKLGRISGTNSDINAAVASATNTIFSKPPKKKPTEDATKKEGAKETAEKDSDKKDSDKKNAAKKDAAKEDSTNNE